MQRVLEEQSALTARLMHEVRTPLTVLKNWIESLRYKGVGGRLDTSVPEKEIAHLDDVLDNFLQWAKTEQTPFDKEELHAVVPTMFVGELASAQSLGKKIEIVDNGSAGNRIFAKPEHLRIVFGNLLENACKHGSGEKIEVMVLDGKISVVSMGSEIPKTIHENFGKPFNRGAERTDGTGLGMANVCSVCKLYGWGFQYEHHKGKNIFTVTFEGSATISTLG